MPKGRSKAPSTASIDKTVSPRQRGSLGTGIWTVRDMVAPAVVGVTGLDVNVKPQAEANRGLTANVTGSAGPLTKNKIPIGKVAVPPFSIVRSSAFDGPAKIKSNVLSVKTIAPRLGSTPPRELQGPTRLRLLVSPV